jgi:hypothetical protein
MKRTTSQGWERKRKRMTKAVSDFQTYVASYRADDTGLDETTFIKDIVYGLGIVLGPQRYAYAEGFDAFKERLRKELGL